MASTTLNLTETLSVSDAVETLISPNRYVENVEDSLGLVDTFVEIHTERYVNNIEDEVALGDGVVIRRSYENVVNLEETIVLNDSFNKYHTVRTILSVDDVIGISDAVVVAASEQFNLDFDELVSLTDFVVVKGTDRTERPVSETIIITDVPIQGFGIKVISGTIDGESFKAFQANDSGSLLTVPLFNWIFVRWLWAGKDKGGIQNIYSPSTTLIVPYGGGEIAAEFFNLGAIDQNIKSLVTILELFDFEYIEDPDGDYILTKVTITIAGDSVGVARTNLTIEQGSSFLRIVIYRDSDGNPVDLTGYTATMQIRRTKESSSVIQELSTSNGYLQLGGVIGTISIILPASITDSLDFVWGRYDLELYPGGNATQAIRLLEGKVNLSKQVTR